MKATRARYTQEFKLEAVRLRIAEHRDRRFRRNVAEDSGRT